MNGQRLTVNTIGLVTPNESPGVALGIVQERFLRFSTSRTLEIGHEARTATQRTADHFRQECERAWPLVETSTKADLRFVGFHMFAYMVF